MNKIITISRFNGSGGKEIGRALAKLLDIPFYDSVLISKAAEESGYSKQAFDEAESKATSKFVYNTSQASGRRSTPRHKFDYSSLSLDTRVFLAQSNIIRSMAAEGPCVIVGRCADYVLMDRPNVVSVFIWADEAARIKRLMDVNGFDKMQAKEYMKETDRNRMNYYNYHTDGKWGLSDNYNLSIRSDGIEIEKSAEVIKTYVEYYRR